jgi:hypothetical protein
VSNLGSFRPAMPPDHAYCHQLRSQSCGTRVPLLTARYAISALRLRRIKLGFTGSYTWTFLKACQRPSISTRRRLSFVVLIPPLLNCANGVRGCTVGSCSFWYSDALCLPWFL